MLVVLVIYQLADVHGARHQLRGHLVTSAII